MKINVTSILRDHMRTLHRVGSNQIDVVDIVVFYCVPVAIMTIAYTLEFSLTQDGYDTSVTFFGILLALLLNVQVAIFAIFQRKWDKPSDPRLADLQQKTIETRRMLLAELNANISYLTLVCCVSSSLVLIFYVWNLISGFAPALTAFLYSHFLLTLIMVIKRSHALFQREYEDEVNDCRRSD